MNLSEEILAVFMEKSGGRGIDLFVPPCLKCELRLEKIEHKVHCLLQVFIFSSGN